MYNNMIRFNFNDFYGKKIIFYPNLTFVYDDRVGAERDVTIGIK